MARSLTFGNLTDAEMLHSDRAGSLLHTAHLHSRVFAEAPQPGSRGQRPRPNLGAQFPSLCAPQRPNPGPGAPQGLLVRTQSRRRNRLISCFHCSFMNNNQNQQTIQPSSTKAEEQHLRQGPQTSAHWPTARLGVKHLNVTQLSAPASEGEDCTNRIFGMNASGSGRRCEPQQV